MLDALPVAAATDDRLEDAPLQRNMLTSSETRR
jgi:hypothetical protein